MTDHVRTSYRRHRRATWGLGLALVLATLAVAIPIASGGSGKTYTLTTTPATCSSPATTVVTLKNTGSPQTLGSAEIYFPPNTVASVSPGILRSNTTSTSSNGAKDIIALDNVNLAPGAFRAITVTLKPGVTFSATIRAVVKQSNRFNDSGGGANLFELQGSFPTLQVVACATVEGRVFHDRDQSGAFGVNAASPTSDLVKPNWTVTLQKQTGPTYTNVDSDLSDTNGLYKVGGPVGSNYRLCVSAPGSPNPDSAIAWAVRQLDDVTLISGCTDITPSSPDSTGLSVAPLTAAGATGQDFAVVPVTVFDFDGGDTAGSGNYVVRAGGDSTKDPQHYVQETWTSNGRPFFVFAPINACTDCGQIYLLEHLQGSVAQSALGAAKQISLVYDDTEPFTNFQPMPYCLQDPRGATPTDLLTDDVLPVGATSCIVEAHQTVDGNGTEQNASVDFEFFVYSSYDGGRGMG